MLYNKYYSFHSMIQIMNLIEKQKGIAVRKSIKSKVITINIKRRGKEKRSRRI